MGLVWVDKMSEDSHKHCRLSMEAMISSALPQFGHLVAVARPRGSDTRRQHEAMQMNIRFAWSQTLGA